MKEIYFTYLSGLDVAKLALTDEEILGVIEGVLRAQGNGETKIEPRVHIVPETSAKGHFNVLRGFIRPINLMGVKVVGDFVDNYKLGLPSESKPFMPNWETLWPVESQGGRTMMKRSCSGIEA